MAVKILVTGADGQLGSELKALAPSFSGLAFIFTSRTDLAIDDKNKVEEFFTKETPSYCINCAAYTAVDKAESEPDAAFLANAIAAGYLAEVSAKYDCRFIHISTDYVFEGNASTPYKEDSLTMPLGIYGASKLEGEQAVLRKNPGAIIIRTSWVYSAYGKNFVKTMIRLMGEKDAINVVNDQSGSPTYAADLAKALLTIIEKDQWVPGIYHYANKAVITWYEFAVAIRDLCGFNCKVNPIDTSQYPTPAVRPGYSVLSTDKFSDTFGIEMHDWKMSLEKCLQKLQVLKK